MYVSSVPWPSHRLTKCAQVRYDRGHAALARYKSEQMDKTKCAHCYTVLAATEQTAQWSVAVFIVR